MLGFARQEGERRGRRTWVLIAGEEPDDYLGTWRRGAGAGDGEPRRSPSRRNENRDEEGGNGRTKREKKMQGPAGRPALPFSQEVTSRAKRLLHFSICRPELDFSVAWAQLFCAAFTHGHAGLA